MGSRDPVRQNRRPSWSHVTRLRRCTTNFGPLVAISHFAAAGTCFEDRVTLGLHQTLGAGLGSLRVQPRPSSTSIPRSSAQQFSNASAYLPCGRPRLRARKKRQPQPNTDGLPQRASHDCPADVRVPPGPSTPETRNFAVTSCLRPATRNPGPRTSATQYLTVSEAHKRKSCETAARCQASGILVTLVVFDDQAGGWGRVCQDSFLGSLKA